MKKRIFFMLFLTSLATSNAEELTNKSGIILGVEASFGFSITHEGTPELLGISSMIGGVYTGYQHYFDDSFGIRVLATIHDGTPIITKFDNNVETSAIPFWTGGRFDVLWDFWDSGEQSAGLNLGIEYAFESYRSRKAKIGKEKFPLELITQHNIYPLFGIYYYYKRIQIALEYRFAGVLQAKAQTDTIKDISVSTRYSFNESLGLSWAYRF